MTQTYYNEEKTILLEISDDGYNAFLTIEEFDDFIDETDIVKLIEESGVKYGIEEAREFIKANNFNKEFSVPFPIAIGSRAKEPEVEFSLLFDSNNSYNSTIGNQFFLLESINKIQKGEPLAHLFITKQAKPGINVFGEEVTTNNSERLLIDQYLGDNVEYDHDRGQIIASQSGYPWVDDLNRINVKSDFSIDHDLVDNEKLVLFGNLTIKGNVSSNSNLQIDGDLFIENDIEDSTIYCTGNLVVLGNILNCKLEGIITEKDVVFNNAENSRIACGGKISFEKNAHFCKLMAEKGVFGSEDNSSIVGGIIQSGEHIEAAIIGNVSNMATEIEISISPFTKEKMLLLTKQIMKMREYEQTDTADFLDKSEKLQILEDKLESEINRALKNDDMVPKHILAFKKVFPGVYLRILKKSMNIVEMAERTSYSIVNNELIAEEY